MLLAVAQPPYDFWRDSIWQFIGVLIALFFGLAGFIGWLLEKRKQVRQKVLLYEVLSDAPIANVNKQVEDRVKILFDNQPVKNMSLLVLKIWNAGSIAVKPDDYIEPIVIEFRGRKPVDGEVLATEPMEIIATKDLKTFITLINQHIKLPTFLLNPRESITIKVLLTEIEATSAVASGNIYEEDGLKKLQALTDEDTILEIQEELRRYSKSDPTTRVIVERKVTVYADVVRARARIADGKIISFQTIRQENGKRTTRSRMLLAFAGLLVLTSVVFGGIALAGQGFNAITCLLAPLAGIGAASIGLLINIFYQQVKYRRNPSIDKP